MLKGKAKGGPRDGVKLSAPETWDGLILDGDGKFASYHNGYYFWSVVEQTWVWHLSSRDIDWGIRHYRSKAF